MKFPPPYPDPSPTEGVPVLRWFILGVVPPLAFLCVASSIAYIVIGVVAKVMGWM